MLLVRKGTRLHRRTLFSFVISAWIGRASVGPAAGRYSVELNQKTVRTIAALIAFAVVAVWAVFRPQSLATLWQALMTIVTPFVVGITVAFLVNLLLQPLEAGWDRLLGGARGRRPAKLKRPISILISVILIAVGVFVLLFIVLPEVARTFV